MKILIYVDCFYDQKRLSTHPSDQMSFMSRCDELQGAVIPMSSAAHNTLRAARVTGPAIKCDIFGEIIINQTKASNLHCNV